jgi:hypothetical protein
MVVKPPVWGLIANYFLYKNHNDYTQKDRISMDTLVALKTVIENKFHRKLYIDITTDTLTKMFSSYGRFFCKDKASNDIIVRNQMGLLEELSFDQEFNFDVQDNSIRIQYKKAIREFVDNPRYHTIPKKELV